MTAASTFPRSHRLGGRNTFRRVREAGVKRVTPCLIMWTIGNDLAHDRVGISIGRPVGNAVVRNLIKRRLREAFRTSRSGKFAGVDLIISVRRHEPLSVQEYRAILTGGR